MFAVLHIVDFALHAVLRNEAGATTRPAALFSGTGKKSVVLAANARARVAGVEAGMTAPQAVARCAALLLRAPHRESEAEARAALLAVGFSLSPAIEDTASGICTVDLSGRIHDFSPADFDPRNASRETNPACCRTSEDFTATRRPKFPDFGYVRMAIDELARLGLPATAGIAATPLLALYAARAVNRSEVGRVIPNAPSECIGPSRRVTDNPPCLSNFVLHVTDSASFLAPLPLAAADPTQELAAVLASWGVRTLGDLTALPRDEIVRRFGAEGLALWQRAAGGALRPLHRVDPPQTFAAKMELEDAVETLEPLLFILRRFLERLALELQSAQHVAAELELTLQLEDDARHARGFRLPEPTADVEILFRTLHTHLESLQTAAAIVAVELKITPARPLVRQQGLFETGLRDPHGFAETLARVSALVGSERVGTPQLVDTHRPDAVKLVSPLSVIPPRAEAPSPGAAGNSPVEGLHPPLGLPLRRFRPPLPARVEFTDSAPTYLWTERAAGEISFQSSAYLSSGEWWQNDRAWRRIEWDIALAGGGLYRLVHMNDAYFLEGEYD
jgi:protein ImuB